jgi:multisubunit Na+/H+ antiporter MnhF subunit
MISVVLYVSISLLGLGALLALVRFVKGPTLPDRVTAFDLFAAVVIGIMAIYSVITGNMAFLDVALVLSLIAFLGAMSFAYYLFKQSKDQNN